MDLSNNPIAVGALSLPVDARIDLVEKLLESLNLPTQSDIETLWAAEAERRLDQIEQGAVELVSGDAVFARLRDKYKR